MHLAGHRDIEADREKRAVALTSVLAALLLVALKLVVGISTNSLGILSEAAHSGLDFLAAVVTYFAVRVSGRPPDTDHPYGHGKVENLSALIETLLLLVTCGFIVSESVDRLFFHPKKVEATWAAFAVMAVSIVVDVSRSRMLRRAAEKHKSQALEADALHFSTDIWSSLVVLVGLLALAIAGLLPEGSAPAAWLERADSLAALAVSGIVVWVSVRLGREAVDVLLDGGSKDMAERIERVVGELAGVAAVRRTRLRQSGPAAFVDMILDIGRGIGFAEADRISREAERRVRELLPKADVVVHIRPASPDPRSLTDHVRQVAALQGVNVHDIELRDVAGDLHLDLHLEVPDTLSLKAAHDQASGLEEALLVEIGGIRSLATHIEPAPVETGSARSLIEGAEHVRRTVEAVASETPGAGDAHGIAALRSGAGLALTFHCRMQPDTPITEAHAASVAMEAALRARLPSLFRVTIHMEPFEPEGSDESKGFEPG